MIPLLTGRPEYILFQFFETQVEIRGKMCCVYSSVCRKAEAGKIPVKQRPKGNAESSDNRRLRPVVPKRCLICCNSVHISLCYEQVVKQVRYLPHCSETSYIKYVHLHDPGFQPHHNLLTESNTNKIYVGLPLHTIPTVSNCHRRYICSVGYSF